MEDPWCQLMPQDWIPYKHLLYLFFIMTFLRKVYLLMGEGWYTVKMLWFQDNEYDKWTIGFIHCAIISMKSFWSTAHTLHELESVQDCEVTWAIAWGQLRSFAFCVICTLLCACKYVCCIDMPCFVGMQQKKQWQYVCRS